MFNLDRPNIENNIKEYRKKRNKRKKLNNIMKNINDTNYNLM